MKRLWVLNQKLILLIQRNQQNLLLKKVKTPILLLFLKKDFD